MPWPYDLIVLIAALEAGAFLAFAAVVADSERRRKGKP